MCRSNSERCSETKAGEDSGSVDMIWINRRVRTYAERGHEHSDMLKYTRMSKTINVDGLDIEVTKKRVKRMNMRIKDPDGSVVISAPYSTPDREIVAFVRSKRGWIDKDQLRRLAEPMAKNDYGKYLLNITK